MKKDEPVFLGGKELMRKSSVMTDIVGCGNGATKEWTKRGWGRGECYFPSSFLKHR